MEKNRGTSATRLFSMIKDEQNVSHLKFRDNQNNSPNFQKYRKDKKEREEALKRLIIQNEEEDDDNNDAFENSQNNYNVYSKPKMIYINENNDNDSYRNTIMQELEKTKNKNMKSNLFPKVNNNENKNIELLEKNNYYNIKENKKTKNKKRFSKNKYRNSNNHTIIIRNKSAKMLKNSNSPYKVKNRTVFAKYSLGNITDDGKESGKNISNFLSKIYKNNPIFNNNDCEKEDIHKIKDIITRNNTINEIKRNEKLEYLKIGDIIILINIFDYNLKENDNLFNHGIIYPETIVSKQLFCLPLSKLNDSHRSKSIFKRSLFRIEIPQNYSKQNQFESLKKLMKNNGDNKNNLSLNEKEYLKIISEKVLEEQKQNESEFLLNFNKKVMFGTVIQLRNIFTNELLTVDFGYFSKEIGCNHVILNPIGEENSQFIFAPSNCLHNFGETIFYNDTFQIIPYSLKNKYYIHVQNTEDVKGNGYELNISRKESIFKLLLFESAELNRKSSIKNEIKSTMVVKLYSIEFQRYLSAYICNIDKALPKLKNYKKLKNYQLNEENKSEDNSNNISSFKEENEDEVNLSKGKNNKNNNKEMENNNMIVNNYIVDKNDILDSSKNSEESSYIQEAYYKIFLNPNNEKQDNCLSYWEIQYEKPYEGKIITSECLIRFRHISSGLYLSYDNDKNELILSQKIDEDSVFYIYNEDLVKNNKKLPIVNEDNIYLKIKNSNMYLNIVANKDKSNYYNLILSKENKFKHEASVFRIELQNNSLIKINYNTNLITNHLINLYEQINFWGTKEAEGFDITNVLLDDYGMALQGEINFKKMVEFYRAILIFVKTEGQETMNDINLFINFQNYQSDQGLIFFLINFILLYDSKTLNIEEEKRGYKGIKEKANPHNIAQKHIGDVIELSFNLIKMLIINNEYSSKNILSCLFLFDELLKNHKIEILEIFVICLKNIFSINLDSINNLYYFNDNYISPTESDENKRKFDILTSTLYWTKKLEEIDEINNNILQQILYLKVLKRLCINKDGSGNLKSQMEITKDLYQNDFLLLKFGIDNNNSKPYLMFKVFDNNEEFFIQNASLNEAKFNNNNLSTPKFYYTSFTEKYSIFIKYICSVLDLYYASCISRNEINIHIMIDPKNIGLTMQHIYLVITDNNINTNIRKRYLKLFRILFVDVFPRERISIKRMKIFLWNVNENEDFLQNIYNWIRRDKKETNNKKEEFGKNSQISKINDNYYILRYFINNFYNDKDFFQKLIDKKDNDKEIYKLLGLIKEMLFLTKESIDFGLWNSKDLIILIENINIYFFVFKFYRKKKNILINENEFFYNYNINMEKNNISEEKMNDLEIKKLIQNNCLAKFIYHCLKSNNSTIQKRCYQIYDIILDIYQLISMIKEDIEKYLFMIQFKKWYDSGESLLNNNYMIQLYNDYIKWKNSSKFYLDNENEQNCEILINNYLFELLLEELNYEFVEYKLYNKSFSMILKNINNQTNFINELNQIEIIVTEEDLLIFKTLIETHKFIKKQIKNIKFIQISQNAQIQNIDLFKNNYNNNNINNEKNKNNKNKNIETIVDDLTNKIDSDLIRKMKLESNNKLSKIQNFCQILEIHKTLIELLKYVLDYEYKSNIYNKIFLFLYHFCFHNYFNQRILKSELEFFFSLIPKYNYIEDVITEIINIYKRSEKSEKIILKIFKRIKEMNLICPEIIRILLSFMFNNQKNNLESNQIIILQNFFDILKDNAFNEFLEESKIVDYIEKIKNEFGENIHYEKEFQSYLNIFEILCTSCINNEYCIISCRKILSIEKLIFTLKSNNYPYKLKSLLLLFLKNVYYPNPSVGDIKIDIKYFFDIS